MELSCSLKRRQILSRIHLCNQHILNKRTHYSCMYTKDKNNLEVNESQSYSYPVGKQGDSASLSQHTRCKDRARLRI